MTAGLSPVSCPPCSLSIRVPGGDRPRPLTPDEPTVTKQFWSGTVGDLAAPAVHRERATSMNTATLGRLTGAVRIGLGAAHVVAPVRISAPLVGDDASSTGAQVFIACFGIRDALLGLALATAHSDDDVRRWLRWTALIDSIDTMGILRHFHELPRRRRWMAVMAPGVPAVLGAVLSIAIGRRTPTTQDDTGDNPPTRPPASGS